MAEKKFAVGQPVKVQNNRGQIRSATVTSVGRLVVHTDAPGERDGFRIDTGALNDKQYSSHGHIYTVEEWAEWQRTSNVRTRLGELGIAAVGGHYQQSLDTLEKVIAILEADAE